MKRHGDSLKYSVLIITLLLCATLRAQSTTYSPYEARMINYVNNGFSYARKWDSLDVARQTLDSCRNFLEQYPRSFARPNVFQYMLEISALLNRPGEEIFPLIDSVLTYDKLPVTKLRVGQILIERNLDTRLGEEIIKVVLPQLTVEYHKIRALRTLASVNIMSGRYSSAANRYEEALKIDPEDLSLLRGYLTLSGLMEIPDRKKVLENKIYEIEARHETEYAELADNGPNINKNLHDMVLTTIDGYPFRFSELKGKVAVLDRFQFWCRICVLEFPALQKMMEEFPSVVFIFLNAGDTADELKKIFFSKKEFYFLAKQKILFTDKKYYNKVYGHSVPHTILLDKKGVVRYEYKGYMKNFEELLRENLKRLTGE